MVSLWNPSERGTPDEAMVPPWNPGERGAPDEALVPPRNPGEQRCSRRGWSAAKGPGGQGIPHGRDAQERAGSLGRRSDANPWEWGHLETGASNHRSSTNNQILRKKVRWPLRGGRQLRPICKSNRKLGAISQGIGSIRFLKTLDLRR